MPATDLASVRTAAKAALVLLAAGTFALPASAQTALSLNTDRVATAPPAVAPSRAELLFQNAESLAIQGRYRQARGAYARAARAQRAEGMLPTVAMWRQAQMYHGGGRLEQAANVLSELAREAESFGDPVVQAGALLEAASLYRAAGRSEEAIGSIQRLTQLRSSPFLPQELRARIDQRLGRA